MIATAKTITDQNRQEMMLRKPEVTVGCLKSDGFSCKSHDNLNSREELPETKDENKTHPRATAVEQRNSFVKEMTPPNGCYKSNVCWQDFYMWPPFHPDLLKVHQSQWNTCDNHFYLSTHDYAYPADQRLQFTPFRMIAPGYPYDFRLQEFQYFVVMDFEATCEKEWALHPQEIIEFPSVLVNSVTGQLEASFQTYVRPSYHQHLTDFCKELTGIQQIQVDRGVPLSEALIMHDKWLEDKGIKHTNFAVVTWGDWDCRVMLESECKSKRIRKPPYFNRWINLKIPFKEVFGVRCNLKDAVSVAGLSWEGRPHCGLDDARNTARILALIMRKGFKFSITNSLVRQSADGPATCLHLNRLPGVNMQTEKMQRSVGPANSPQFYPLFNPNTKEMCTYCFCGVRSSKCMTRQRGPNQGRYFFGCGNWTTTRGALCSYFEWAS